MYIFFSPVFLTFKNSYRLRVIWFLFASIRSLGIYRAIGARQTDVFWLFVLQAALICALGAACGLLAAHGMCLAASHWTGYGVSASPQLMTGCFGVAVGCGVLSGLAPALHATHLDPVQTMRG